VSSLRLKPVITAFAGFVLGASIFTVSTALAAPNNSNTFTIRVGSSLNVTCANALTNTNVQKSSETVACGSTPTSTTTSTTPRTTTTTHPPTTTTTTVPPTTTTTTTTTTPSGANCVAFGGGFPFYGDPTVTASTGNPAVDVNYQDVGGINLTGSMCDPTLSDSAWSFSANAGAAADQGAVQAYPDVQSIFTLPTNTYPPLSGYSSITSTFSSTNPPDSQGNWEEAYDIWLGGYSNDIMIWVNTSDERGASSSYGGATIDGQATIDGISYTLIHFGGGAQPERMLVMNTPENSGTVNIKDVLDYLIIAGDVPSTVGVAQINFGWEICHTDGATLNYALNSYGLSAS